eukprot:CAMPEP_0113555950 /NCGR_PEP_ID=MMETSP0015_2-20120614/16995_1 /TAXON_ID=2838 /ORGANISM="Odontella" /LENGTH=311 /DNA_ID=CAMNT_0000457271 /DNA_START=229 /DNA_END=1164 /DNA_ORIENTATION=+ /assembly_acc=CAM_ASM_000160
MTWLRQEELPQMASSTSMEPRELTDMFVDLSVFGEKETSDVDLEPSLLHIRPETFAAPIVSRARHEKFFSEKEEEAMAAAEEVAEMTIRWSNDFVRRLNLCPWAKTSLTTDNAIRVKIVPEKLGLGVFHDVVRLSAWELLRATGDLETNENDNSKQDGSGISRVDPNAAITFVVASPSNPGEYDPFHQTHEAYEFKSFLGFVEDMEDGFFDEADNSEDGGPYIGDYVTIAPFHPLWHFASAEEDDNSIDWEKRTPFPTVSLVCTSAIMAAGEESTRRIGEHNEDLLASMTPHQLGRFFRERVLKKETDNES